MNPEKLIGARSNDLNSSKSVCLFSFSLFHLNIQSIKNKTLEMEVVLNDLDSNFLLLNEHWCTATELKYINIKGYHLIS